MGLAISRQLATLMGGTLSVESELGRGTTFTLDLPLADAQAPSHDPSPPSSLRILVAEDNALGRAMLREWLEAEGHRAKLVPTGAAALEAARHVGPGPPCPSWASVAVTSTRTAPWPWPAA